MTTEPNAWIERDAVGRLFVLVCETYEEGYWSKLLRTGKLLPLRLSPKAMGILRPFFRRHGTFISYSPESSGWHETSRLSFNKLLETDRNAITEKLGIMALLDGGKP